MAETCGREGCSQLAVREEEKLSWGNSEDWLTERGVRSLHDSVQISLLFRYTPVLIFTSVIFLQ